MPVPTSDGNPAPASDPTSPGTKSLTTPKPSPATQTTPLTKTATVSKGTQPKTTSSPKSSPSKAPAAAPTLSTPPAEGKKVRRKASKPIINWFQRKLAGRKPITPHAPGIERGRDPGPKYPRPRSVGPASSRKRRSGATAGDADGEHETSIRDGTSVRSRSLSPSLGPGSMWSPSMQPEADDDASIRPLPPTSPPSPSPSNTTHLTQTTHSGYGSDPRTVASHTASTKPTTLLSVDIGIVGTPAHIAQANPSIPTVVAPSPSSSPQFARFPSTRSMHQPVPSTASVTFSTVPYPSSPLSTSPYFLAEDDVQDLDASTQAPSHSLPHPRNNPRPSSPPLDNASMLTLASSTFNNPCQVEQDAVSASVRAIRRRGSWESGESRWSAVMGLRRPGSTRTAGSWRTGASIGGGIMLDPNQIEPFDGESGSESDTEDKENGADIKAEEVPLPESPVKGHISPVTPLSIQTELPVGLETGGGRTSDEAPSTAIPGRASLDYGEETEKESDGGHGEEPKAKESEKTKVKKIGDAISAALDSLPE